MVTGQLERGTTSLHHTKTLLKYLWGIIDIHSYISECNFETHGHIQYVYHRVTPKSRQILIYLENYIYI